MKKLNGTLTLVIGIVGTLIVIGGIVYAMGEQGNKLETAVKTQDKIHTKVEKHETDIAVLKTNINHIKEGVDKNTTGIDDIKNMLLLPQSERKK